MINVFNCACAVVGVQRAKVKKREHCLYVVVPSGCEGLTTKATQTHSIAHAVQPKESISFP
jgi:hypothetical protein